jgi:hypothetical protein
LPRAKVTNSKATVAAIGKILEVMSESLRCVFHGNIQKTLDYERTFILAIELSNTSWVLTACKRVPKTCRVRPPRSLHRQS